VPGRRWYGAAAGRHARAAAEGGIGVKVVAITGPGQVELVERPDPSPRADWAVVRVHVAPMCTEYKAFREGRASDALGHEAAGEVVAVAGPGPVREGDRVVVLPQALCGRCELCRSGEYIYCREAPDARTATGSPTGTATFAQYVVKQQALLVPIPPGLAAEHAALACCGLGPTFGALRRLGVDATDTVVITGMGPVGLGGVVGARARGARVLAVEGNPYRARLALELGAEAVVDPADPDAARRLRELTGGGGPDKGIECSGSPQAQRLLVEAVRPRGAVALIGEGAELTVHVSRDLLRKGLTLHGCWHYNLADAPRLLGLIARLAPTGILDRLITHAFPMSRVREAWELQRTGQCGKVLLYPWA
jgi:L-iditol 2-dehydrogenase